MHGHSASIHSEMKRDSRSLLRQKPRADMEVGWLRCNQLMMATPLDFFSRQLATHEPVICTAHRRRWTTQHPQKCPRFSIFVTIPMSTSVQIWTPILRGKLYSNQPTGYEGRTTKVKQFCQCSQYSVEQHIFPNSNKFLNHRKLHNTIASVYRVGK